MKIFLVRHGESVDDIEDCYGGMADFQLSEGGRRTARDLTNQLVNRGIVRMYTSPYKRAHETATIIGAALGSEPVVIPDLRERNSYGVLSGVNKAVAKEIFGQVLATVRGKPGDFYSSELLPGAEALPEFNARVKNAFDTITADADGLEGICIVTHGNVTRSIYSEILRVPGKVDLDLLAITVLDYTRPRLNIESQVGVRVSAAT